jgi:hypothetical protein
MMFTSSDASSLVRELWWWERAEYVFGALVAAACAGEYIADFNRRPWVEAHKERIAKISTLVLVAALVFELICITRANAKSDEVIGKLRDEAEAADKLAQSAVQNSNTALAQSRKAITNADAAGAASDKAQQKTDVVARKADELAAKLVRTEDDLGQLQYMVSARHISDINALIDGLKPFKAMPVVLRSYAFDADGTGLCKTLLYAAQKAEMTPVDDCEKWPVTSPGMTGIQLVGPDWDVLEKIAQAIAWSGRVWGGVSSGKSAPGTPLTIFVGLKNPFWIGGQVPPTPKPKSTKNKTPVKTERR